MPPKAASGKPQAAAAEKQPESGNMVEPLSDDELQFVWKSLVEEGKLNQKMLRKFLEDITGTRLSVMQAKDLLSYMDMDGDGRVGQQDFKAFMQTSCLAQTDAPTFMWRPKAKYREQMAKESKPGEDTFGLTRPASGEGEKHPPSRGSLASSGPVSMPKKQTTSQDLQLKAKIDRVVAKYEKDTWDRLLEEEEQIMRHIFAQFTEKGGEEGELDAKGFHKMVTQWFPLAQWSAAGAIRPADSLATMHHLAQRAEATRGREGAGSGEAAPAEAGGGELKISYGVWLDCVRGKLGPDDQPVAPKK